MNHTTVIPRLQLQVRAYEVLKITAPLKSYNKMKYTFLLLLFMNTAYSQKLTIGKYKNFLTNRSIEQKYVGAKINTMSPLYYKFDTMNAFKRAGFLANNLDYYLNNSISKKDFEAYKYNKKISLALRTFSYISFGIWFGVSLYQVDHGKYNPQNFWTVQRTTFLSNPSLPFLACFFISDFGARKFRVKSELKLLDSVKLYNRKR